MKKVLVTGSAGFVGMNLVECLRLRDDVDLRTFDKNDDDSALTQTLMEVDFIFHLAGVNRPERDEEFYSGNVDLTERLLDLLRHNQRCVPVLLSSSTQAALDNPYGNSKRQAEEKIFHYGNETGTPVYVYRLPNLFGKWCRPNYNSVVATFCHNISHCIPIKINDPNITLTLAYIDDVLNSFCSALDGKLILHGNYANVDPVHTIKLGDLADVLRQFKYGRDQLSVPDMTNQLNKKLYSTYLSYLPTDNFSYTLNMNIDERGSFTEFLRTEDRGQISINVSKPGITKGNHWHHTKVEKFLVISGRGVIRFRKIGESDILEYAVSCKKLEVVDIPPGYTHNITNTGNTEMVTVMWVNEPFDSENPDTYFEPV